MKIEKIEYLSGTKQEVKEKVNGLIKKGWQPVNHGVPFESSEIISKWHGNTDKIVKNVHIIQTMALYESN